MEKLEKTKKKHDHKGTKILKLIIFACVMLAPFFSILVRCLYILNPNAKDSYSAKTIYQQFAITNNTQYPDNQVINIKYRGEITGSESVIINFNYISYTAEDLGLSQADYDSISYIRFQISTQQINFRSGTTTITSKSWNSDVDFNILTNGLPSRPDIYTYAYISQIILVQDSLDNAFEYSINQLAKSNYYNWTQNTGIYDGLNAMCTGLGVNNVIAILLTYWALCTAIYIVFDIVIELFTKLTHFINAE